MFARIVDRLRRSTQDDAARPAPPQAPPGRVLYAVGDVHGELDLLDRLLAKIAADHAEHAADLDPVTIFLGDYIDRGSDSRGVVDRLLSREDSAGMERRCLLGNHEQAMLNFLENPESGAGWLDYGGMATLAGYGMTPHIGAISRRDLVRLRDELAERLPPEHYEWLKALEPWVAYGDYAFAHAGIRPGRPLAAQTLDDLLWIRKPFLESRARHEKVIVHGHTITPTPLVLNNRIAVDTGAYATGVLTAVALQADRMRMLHATRFRADRVKSESI